MDQALHLKALICQLTDAELQQRKAGAIASLKDKILNKHPLPNGYRYEFAGANGILDELMTFIKAERQCCEFFRFDLSLSDTNSHILLSITGPEGAKDFLDEEMGM